MRAFAFRQSPSLSRVERNDKVHDARSRVNSRATPYLLPLAAEGGGIGRQRRPSFDGLWLRMRGVPQGGSVVVRGELRNRSGETARAVALPPVASSMLETSIEPRELDLPAGGRAVVDVTVQAMRVGRWGVHGLALEIRGTPLGGEGLYEVPLLFANPLGVEVLPPSLPLSSSRRAAAGRGARRTWGARRTRGHRATSSASCGITSPAIRSSASRGRRARVEGACSCARWSATSARSCGWCSTRRSSCGQASRACSARSSRRRRRGARDAPPRPRRSRRARRDGLCACAPGSSRTPERLMGPSSPGRWRAPRARSMPTAPSSTRRGSRGA